MSDYRTFAAPGLHMYGNRVYQALAEFTLVPCNTSIVMWPKRRKAVEKDAVPKKEHTTLTSSVLRSDYDAMRQIVAAGADPNEFDDFGMTPLLWAIMRGDIAAVRMLLECGADPNIRPNPSDSPLWSAEDDWGFVEIAALLRSYGAVK